jgi:hypothetical protein
MTFGSNENLIFVLIATQHSLLSLLDDSSGTPVILWARYMSIVSFDHIVSNLKASVETGKDMIAFANGAT